MTEWEALAKALGRDPTRYPLTPDDRKTAGRIDLLLDMLREMYQTNRTRVILYAKSPNGIVKHTYRTLFSVDVSNYPDPHINNKKRPGYSISIAELARHLLQAMPEEQQEGEAQGQEGSNNQ
jgi:hypothetical protein